MIQELTYKRFMSLDGLLVFDIKVGKCTTDEDAKSDRHRLVQRPLDAVPALGFPLLPLDLLDSLTEGRLCHSALSHPIAGHFQFHLCFRAPAI